MIIVPMTLDDYDDVIALWQSESAILLREADSRENLARYLERNPGMSFVAREADRLIGAVLCGHDGRRGYLHHLVVDPGFRRQGVGTVLYRRCLKALEKEGILKCHLFVFQENEAAKRFWERCGWQRRTDSQLYSYIPSGSTGV